MPIQFQYLTILQFLLWPAFVSFNFIVWFYAELISFVCYCCLIFIFVCFFLLFLFLLLSGIVSRAMFEPESLVIFD